MLNLNQLYIFCRIVEKESVTAASQELHLSQPAVTAHLRFLEKFYNSKLVYRHRRGIKPTEAGLHVYGFAKKILLMQTELSSVIGEMKIGTHGKINIGTSISLGVHTLPRLLAEYLRKHPNVEINVSTSGREKVYEGLRTGNVDIGYVITSLPPQDLVCDFLRPEPCVIVASPNHPLASKKKISLDQLKGQSFILPSPDSEQGAFILRFLEAARVRDYGVSMRIIDPLAVKEIVAQGIGLAALFRSTVENDVKAGKLRILALGDLPVMSNLYAMYKKGHHFTGALTEFSHYMKEKISSNRSAKSRKQK